MSHIQETFHSVMVHDPAHSNEDIIINRDIFPQIAEGDYVQVYMPETPAANRLTLRVPIVSSQNAAGALSSSTTRYEISLSKAIAEVAHLKAYSKVIVKKIDNINEVSLDFVELAFKKQFLQRGNMWRFKDFMLGRSVYVGGNASASTGIQSQVQELLKNRSPVLSGVITPSTHFIYRSRSTRLIWLIQISMEMWEIDQYGDLYFDKFLNKLVTPIVERWKTLGVTHSLTIVFFARTMFVPVSFASSETKYSSGRSTGQIEGRLYRLSELLSRNSVYRSDSSECGNTSCYYEDLYKVVIENIADVDRAAQLLRTLKKEFWGFAKLAGWTSPAYLRNLTAPKEQSLINNEVYYAATPSDATNGAFLAAINASLNLLEKHYMDRDLTRTGNSMVMISAGTGIFKVWPSMTLITKQRMMDSGIGLDLISLSQPPLHAVPLFLVNCSSEHFQISDFYEVPYWINIGYVDSERYCACEKRNRRLHEGDDGSAGAFTSVFGVNHFGKSNYGSVTMSLMLSGPGEKGGGRLISVGDYVKKYTSLLAEQSNALHNGILNTICGGAAYGLDTDSQTSVGRRFLRDTDVTGWWKEFLPLPFPSLLSGHVTNRMKFQRALSKHYIERKMNPNKVQASFTCDGAGVVEWGYRAHDWTQNSGKVFIDSLPLALSCILDGVSDINREYSDEEIAAIAHASDVLRPWGFAPFDFGLGERFEGISAESNSGIVHPLVKFRDRLLQHYLKETDNLASCTHHTSNNTIVSDLTSPEGTGNDSYKERQDYIQSVARIIPSNANLLHQYLPALPRCRGSFDRLHGLSQSDSGLYLASSAGSATEYMVGVSPGAASGMLVGSGIPRKESQNSLNSGVGREKRPRKIPGKGKIERDKLDFDNEEIGLSDEDAGDDMESCDDHFYISASYEAGFDDGSSHANESEDGGGFAIHQKDKRQKVVIKDIFQVISSYKDKKSEFSEEKLMLSPGGSSVDSCDLVKLLDEFDNRTLAVMAGGRGGKSPQHTTECCESVVSSDKSTLDTDVLNPRVEPSVKATLNPTVGEPANGKLKDVAKRPVGILKHSASSANIASVKSGSGVPGTSVISDVNAAFRSSIASSVNMFSSPLQFFSSKPIISTPAATAPIEPHTNSVPAEVGISPAPSNALVQHDSDKKRATAVVAGKAKHVSMQLTNPNIIPAVAAGSYSKTSNFYGMYPEEGRDRSSSTGNNSTVSSFEGNDLAKRVRNIDKPLARLKVESEERKLSFDRTNDSSVENKKEVLGITPHRPNLASSPSARSLTRSSALLSGSFGQKPSFEKSSDSASVTTAKVAIDEQSKLEFDAKLEFYKGYRAKYSVNPFKKEESLQHLYQRTQNRRRWSHVFAEGSQTSKLAIGLNWKSLCQPAILPLTTDYLPAVQDIFKHYEVAANYSKILVDDMSVSGFDNHANLLMEMICQRLAMDYQIVENIPILEYKEFFNLPQAVASRIGGTTSRSVFSAVNNSVEYISQSSMIPPSSGGHQSDYKFYILSMGHRIQFMLYDPIDKQLTVRLWVYSKAKNSRDSIETYNYQLWVPQLQKFQTTTQVFYQYAKSEYGWSNSDEILLGDSTLEYTVNNLRAKRLRYVIIPDFWPSGGISNMEYLWEKPVDGIPFVFKIQRSASTPINDIAGFGSTPAGPVVSPMYLNSAALAKWNSVLLPLIISKATSYSACMEAYKSKFEKLFAFIKKSLAEGEKLNVNYDATLDDASLRGITVDAADVTPVVGAPSPLSAVRGDTGGDTLGSAMNTPSAAAIIDAPLSRAFSTSLIDTNISPISTSSGSAKSQSSESSRKYQFAKMWLNRPGSNPKWVYVRCDNTFSLSRAFHLEFSWISCDSWLLEDWVNLMFRRCSGFNLRIVQLPEFFFSADVQLHSFRAQPFIPIPSTYKQRPGKGTVSPALIVERIFLRMNTVDWIEDDEQFTDWSSVGVPSPDPDVLHRNNLTINPFCRSGGNFDDFLQEDSRSTSGKSGNSNAPSSSAPTPTSALTASIQQQELQRIQRENDKLDTRSSSGKSENSQSDKKSVIAIGPRSASKFTARSSSQTKDRQYVLKMGNGGVRVACFGFVWLLNMSARINDSSTSSASASNAEERKDLGLAKLHEFLILCCDVGICFDIIMETIDSVFGIVDARKLSGVEIPRSFSDSRSVLSVIVPDTQPAVISNISQYNQPTANNGLPPLPPGNSTFSQDATDTNFPSAQRSFSFAKEVPATGDKVGSPKSDAGNSKKNYYKMGPRGM